MSFFFWCLSLESYCFIWPLVLLELVLGFMQGHLYQVGGEVEKANMAQ